MNIATMSNHTNESGPTNMHTERKIVSQDEMNMADSVKGRNSHAGLTWEQWLVINNVTVTTNTMSDEEVDKRVEKVMDVLAMYFWSPSDDTGVMRASHWPGRDTFKKHAAHWVRLNEPVQMVLPAFPFKSVSEMRIYIYLYSTKMIS